MEGSLRRDCYASGWLEGDLFMDYGTTHMGQGFPDFVWYNGFICFLRHHGLLRWIRLIWHLVSLDAMVTLIWSLVWRGASLDAMVS